MLYDRRFSPADQQTMGGMIAGGEMVYGSGVFFLVALAPTALALWFLRESKAFWTAFSLALLALTLAGLGATIFFVTVRVPAGPQPMPLLFVELLALAQMLGSPLWAGGCALFAWLAPARGSRRRLIAAAAIEVVIGGFALVHFGGALRGA